MSVKFIKPSGSLESKFMIVGEAPGKDEVEAGEPFVGKSGKFLLKILNELGISREEIYITNAVKVRPSGNKTPTDEELKSWQHILCQETTELKPKVILTLGSCAAKAVLSRFDIKISDVRGVPLPYYSGHVICCFHPAYIIRNPSRIDTFKKDIKLAIDTYKGV